MHAVCLDCCQVMPSQDARIVPNTAPKITTDYKMLAAGFDPAKPLSFEVEFEELPELSWVKSYKDIEIAVEDTGGVGGKLLWSTAAAVVTCANHTIKEV